MDRRVVRASFSAESTTVRIIDSVPTLMIRCSVLKRSMSFKSTLEMEVEQTLALASFVLYRRNGTEASTHILVPIIPQKKE